MSTEHQTKTLKKYLIELKDRFEESEAPENRRDRDFFQMVKIETDPIYQLLDEWEDATLIRVKERTLRVHPHQVSSTKENMELLILHSYFIDVRRKRYMELYNSVIYIFDQILNECSQSN